MNRGRTRAKYRAYRDCYSIKPNSFFLITCPYPSFPKAKLQVPVAKPQTPDFTLSPTLTAYLCQAVEDDPPMWNKWKGWQLVVHGRMPRSRIRVHGGLQDWGSQLHRLDCLWGRAGKCGIDVDYRMYTWMDSKRRYQGMS